ncbi:c-type cytochrome [Beggiatoa leptomitoformis]|uniref:Cytochrome c domain-containing protein n=1 Tax=Beggiatoa leptomitoformis TaxID=288004 RepID=A0A2N9YFI2_9GAMM|nr:cytochrome c [Beggiatoa leptomitoformis]ALG68385.1 hypothetical protein AL038_12560 [Beggiatoa leptomitoformis]AUI69291.1 hypothetical protein BLE401_11705 [Beggiatoa leptomitoformis]
MLRHLIYFSLLISLPVFAENQLITPDTILYQTDTPLSAYINLPTVYQGDLYLATLLSDQQLYFLTAQSGLQITPTPFYTNQSFQGLTEILSLNIADIPAGIYPLYQVITATNQSPLDATNWLTPLNIIAFSIGLPPHITGDYNRDGLADTDCNANGLADDTLGCEQTYLSQTANTNYKKEGRTLYQTYCNNCHGQRFLPAQFAELIRQSISIVPEKQPIIGQLSNRDFDKIAAYINSATSTQCRSVGME